MLLSRDHGQQLHGVPLPKVSEHASEESPFQPAALWSDTAPNTLHFSFFSSPPLLFPPQVVHLFGVIVKGAESDWARHFPARLFLRMGRRLHNDYPFTLINDRFREEVFSAGEFEKARNLSRGVCCQCVSSERPCLCILAASPSPCLLSRPRS